MFSIIIPLYNKESYVAETITSVLNQTFVDFEMIVIDDGSTDGSARVVKSFNDTRITYEKIENSGVSVARNAGVKIAKYDYITFLDADDWWAPTFLEEMVVLINKYPDERVFASGRVSVFQNKRVIYSNRFLPSKGTEGLVDYIKIISESLPPVNSSNSIFKSDALLKAGLFKEGQKKHEDHDLWLRVCKNHLVVFLNKDLSFYRKDVLDSASKGIYRFEDFISYLETIFLVKKEIHKERLRYFKKYYNRYILLTFIKYENAYTKIERRRLLEVIKKICDSPQLFFIKLINLMPSGYVYTFLKKLKRA